MMKMRLVAEYILTVLAEYTKVFVWFVLVITVIILAAPFIIVGFAARIIVVGTLFGYDKCTQFINWLF